MIQKARVTSGTLLKLFVAVRFIGYLISKIGAERTGLAAAERDSATTAAMPAIDDSRIPFELL
jgi:hypothetical protein